jgi:uncharacterized protein (TIGR02246 family)
MDDIEEIKKLKARYFRGLDSKDWVLYESCFAEDIVVDLTRAGGEKFDGRAKFMAYATAMPMVQSVHNGHMPEIELTGPDTAAGVWALEDYNIWEDGTQNHGWGHYLETYVKRDDRWQIRTMALSYLRIDRPGEQAVLVAGAEGTKHLHGFRPAG